MKKELVNKGNQNVADVTDIDIAVSNNIIMGIGKQTLLGKKVFLLALGKVADRKKADYKNMPRYKEYLDMGFDLTTGMVAEIDMADIRPAFGKSQSGSKYEQLNKLFKSNPTPDELQNTLHGMFNMLVKNDVTGIYARTSMIQTTLYDKKHGKLFVKFTEEPIVRQNVIALKSNFTKLPKEIMMNLFNFYAYSMYQMLKADYDKQNAIRITRGESAAQTLKMRYELAELKFKLGILAANKPEVSSALEVRNPHYTEIEEVYMALSSSAMPRYNDFRRYVLVPAKKELEEKTDMSIDFEPVKSGRKIVAVDIYVTIKSKNSEIHNQETLSDDEKLDIEQEIFDLIEEKITLKDIKKIADAAEYDIQKVKDAYEYMKNYSSPIESVVGFLISTIKEHYVNVPGIQRKKSSKNMFNDFEQRDYDFDKLEKEFLERDKVKKRDEPLAGKKGSDKLIVKSMYEDN